MRANKLKTAVLGLICAGVIAAPVWAAITTWEACDSGPTDAVFDFSWCEGSWSTAGNWSNGVPDSAADQAVIWDATTSDPNGLTDCPVSASDINALTIFMATKTFDELEIKSIGNGRLRLEFIGSGTLTVNDWVKINAVNGDVIVEIDGGGKIQTN